MSSHALALVNGLRQHDTESETFAVMYVRAWKGTVNLTPAVDELGLTNNLKHRMLDWQLHRPDDDRWSKRLSSSGLLQLLTAPLSARLVRASMSKMR